MLTASDAKLGEQAALIRRLIIEVAGTAGTGHIATALSMVDILTILYFEKLRIGPSPSLPSDHQDHLVVSKGHGGLGIYAAQNAKGLLSDDELRQYHHSGTRMTSFPGEPFSRGRGLTFASGSLGHGASTACGLALAAKMDGVDSHVYTVLSDGECQEGAIWEAALFAAQHKLDNLTFIVDYNKFQAIGRIDDILSLEPFVDKWRAFGWDAAEADGHDFKSLRTALKPVAGKPKAVVAHTTKGKGVTFMEGSVDWHYLPVTGDKLQDALKEVQFCGKP